MKKKMSTLLLLLAAVSTAWSQASKMNIDSNASSVQWNAKKVTGEHEGTIKLIEGNLEMDGETISGGNFTVDMTTIDCTDLTGEYKGKLKDI